MDVKQLRALVAIAETGTVTGAAAVMNTVQPGISRMLRLLEEELGVVLFERRRSGMVPTRAGQILLQHARRIVHDVEQARQAVRPFSTEDVEGVVTIGLMRSIYERYSGAVLRTAKQRFDRVELKLILGYSDNIADWVRHGEVDAAVLSLAGTAPGLDLDPLVREGLFLVGLPDAGLDLARPVPFAQLDGAGVSLPPYAGHLRAIVEDACRGSRARPRFHAATDWSGFPEVLRHAGGYLVLPASSILDALEKGQVAAAPLVEPAANRTVCIAHSTARERTPAAAHIVDLIRHLIRRHIEDGGWPSAAWLQDQDGTAENVPP